LRKKARFLALEYDWKKIASRLSDTLDVICGRNKDPGA